MNKFLVCVLFMLNFVSSVAFTDFALIAKPLDLKAGGPHVDADADINKVVSSRFVTEALVKATAAAAAAVVKRGAGSSLSKPRKIKLFATARFAAGRRLRVLRARRFRGRILFTALPKSPYAGPRLGRGHSFPLMSQWGRNASIAVQARGAAQSRKNCKGYRACRDDTIDTNRFMNPDGKGKGSENKSKAKEFFKETTSKNRKQNKIAKLDFFIKSLKTQKLENDSESENGEKSENSKSKSTSETSISETSCKVVAKKARSSKEKDERSRTSRERKAQDGQDPSTHLICKNRFTNPSDGTTPCGATPYYTNPGTTPL